MGLIIRILTSVLFRHSRFLRLSSFLVQSRGVLNVFNQRLTIAYNVMNSSSRSKEENVYQNVAMGLSLMGKHVMMGILFRMMGARVTALRKKMGGNAQNSPQTIH